MHPDPNGLDKDNYKLYRVMSVTEQALTELSFVGKIANILMICLHNIRIDLRFPSVIVYKT